MRERWDRFWEDINPAMLIIAWATFCGAVVAVLFD